MNELQNFNFNNLQVRTVLIDSEPWFVVADVAKAIEATNPTDLAKLVDDEDKSRQSLGSGSPKNIINESGLYQILLRSNNRNAKPFRKWVTREVLPTIRKHGAYMTDSKAQDVLSGSGLADLLLQAGNQIKKLESEKATIQIENQELVAELEEATEKTRYLDLILESPDKMTATQIAFDYGMSAAAFNKLLSSFKIQRKVNGQWILYRQYMGKGYTKTETFPITHKDGRRGTTTNTVWTQKGREFLYRKLKKNGYLPLVEQDDLAS